MSAEQKGVPLQRILKDADYAGQLSIYKFKDDEEDSLQNNTHQLSRSFLPHKIEANNFTHFHIVHKHVAFHATHESTTTGSFNEKSKK